MSEEESRKQLLEEVRRLRRRVEAKEEHWRLFSLATTNLLWNWDFTNDTVERSVGFERAFGYSRGEVLPGIDWWVDRLHPDDRDRVLAVFGAARDAGRERCTYEYRFRRRDGTFAHISDNVFLLYDPSGRPVRALGAMTDISERVRMETALRESEERFRSVLGSPGRVAGPRSQLFIDTEDALRLSTAILSTLAQGVVLVRPEDQTIAFTNPRFEELFGYGPGELVGRPISVVNAPGSTSPEQVADGIVAALERDGVWTGEVQNITKDGRTFWCSASVSPLQTAEFGKVFVSVHTDITEQKESAERRRRITEELDHRVKNNLASIIGLATQTARRAETIEEFLEGFVPRLRAMARVHEALASEGWGELDLRELVDDTVRVSAVVDGQVSTKGPACKLSPSEAAAFGAVLHELTTNAVKHGALSSPSGHVSIDWRLDGADFVLAWSERGGPTVSASPTTGFGLTLVRGLVEHELGGEVSSDFSPQGVQHSITFRRSS